MELVHHGLWIWEFVHPKIKIAVVILPVVVNHENSDGETVFDNIFRVFFNVGLVLVVHQLNPRIVLRH